MAQEAVQESLEAKRIKELAKLAARTAKLARLYFEALRNLNKTVPPETRAVTAKYAAKLKKALKGEASPQEVGEALLEMKREWRSWKVEHAEDIKIVSDIAKAFYGEIKKMRSLEDWLIEQFASE